MTILIWVAYLWIPCGLLGLLIASARCRIYFSELFDPDIMPLKDLAKCLLGGFFTLIYSLMPNFPKDAGAR